MVWGYDREIETNTLDAFMHLLREKVDTPGETKLIHTVRGVATRCARTVRCERAEAFDRAAAVALVCADFRAGPVRVWGRMYVVLRTTCAAS